MTVNVGGLITVGKEEAVELAEIPYQVLTLLSRAACFKKRDCKQLCAAGVGPFEYSTVKRQDIITA